MKNFKLLGIRPRQGCDEDFLKVLEADTLYQFYQEYEFEYRGNEVKKAYRRVETVPDNFFQPEKFPHDFDIHITAIVGKNGSGKSTLTELLFLIIYNMAVDKKLLRKDRKGKTPEAVTGLYAELYFEIGSMIIQLTVDSRKESNTSFILKKTENIADSRDFYIDQILDHDSFFHESFFYSVVINYSFYGLNHNDIGWWVDSLFHKNDGYRAPIVINPYREEGSIEVEKEKLLVRQRLLANLLEPIGSQKPESSLRALTKDKIAFKLQLTFNDNKVKCDNEEDQKKLDQIKNKEEVLERLYKLYIGKDLKKSPPFKRKEEVLTYLYKKLRKICRIYDWYSPFLHDDEYEFVVDKVDTFIEELYYDESHITFKLKQALNFLANPKLPNLNWENTFEFEIETLSEQIKRLKGKVKVKKGKPTGRKIYTLEWLPPSFFDIKVIFSNGSELKDCSSGEKQKIHATNSLLYHLINLNSVSKASKDSKRLAYQYVNLILDEIELYFHPDFQRTFINDILESITKVNRNLLNELKGINLIFLTHSPFILSDIPTPNVLSLEVNKRTGKSLQRRLPMETFGANIHELFAESFFMKPTIGAFATNKINKWVDDITLKQRSKEIEKNQVLREEYLKGIKLIGEPLIRERMLEIYQANIKDEESELEKLKKRIEELESREKNASD